MKVCGIITEYNPFHHGHQYHIEQARLLTKCDVLIAVMSGNFVQRGEPAIINKWERAKCAIAHGVDIVIELPFPFVVQSADHFAKAAVQLLDLADVQDIVFGSETNNLAHLQQIASLPFTKKHQRKDESMAKSFEKHTKEFSSNDLLGICYLRALQNTKITPHTIQRTNAYLGEDLQTAIASATAIRKGVQGKKDILHTTPMAEQLTTTFFLEKYYPYLQTLFMTLPSEYIAGIFLMDEGIEHLLIKNAKECTTLDEFLNKSTSARYTTSRIQRTLIHFLNQTSKQDINTLPPLSHLRILAFNDIGKTYLATLRKKENLILASRFNQIPQPYRQLEERSIKAYAYPLSALERKAMIESEVQSPLYIKKQ